MLDRLYNQEDRSLFSRFKTGNMYFEKKEILYTSILPVLLIVVCNKSDVSFINQRRCLTIAIDR